MTSTYSSQTATTTLSLFMTTLRNANNHKPKIRKTRKTRRTNSKNEESNQDQSPQQNAKHHFKAVAFLSRILLSLNSSLHHNSQAKT
eukprot:15031554-Ditylum_brightwellii.AAC.1